MSTVLTKSRSAATPAGPRPADAFVAFGITVRLLVEAQHADAPQAEQIALDMEFAQEGGEGATPYEVRLQAAMVGDSTRFARQDSVEEAWRIMQPLLDAPPPVHPYAAGSWGPEEADRLIAGDGRWYGPWVAS